MSLLSPQKPYVLGSPGFTTCDSPSPFLTNWSLELHGAGMSVRVGPSKQMGLVLWFKWISGWLFEAIVLFLHTYNQHLLQLSLCNQIANHITAAKHVTFMNYTAAPSPSQSQKQSCIPHKRWRESTGRLAALKLACSKETDWYYTTENHWPGGRYNPPPRILFEAEFHIYHYCNTAI